jgi:enoyl-CoA hydratase
VSVIASQHRDRVGLIRIDRHERRNALDTEHCDALRAAADRLVAAGARALVVTGDGSSFCAGADLGGVYGDEFRASLYGMLRGIAALPVPVVAAVNGPAIGAGTQLAIACDLRVAAAGATFAVPTARNGLAVDPWTVRRLALLAGGGPARALLLGGGSLDAARAHTLGLVDRLGDLDAALAWAEEISEFAPLSLRYAKIALEALLEPQPWDGAVDEAFAACWASEDKAEGERARAQRRAPRFLGR